MRPTVRRWTAAAAGAWLLAAGLVAVPQLTASTAATEPCPPGQERVRDVERELAPDRASRLAEQYQGPLGPDYRDVLRNACVPRDRAEPFADLALRDAQAGAIRTAPFDTVAAGASLAAAQQREAMLAAATPVPGSAGSARQYGVGPLNFDDPRYAEVNGTGIVDATGRIDDFEFDAASGRLFAAIGTGGVWLSEDLGQTWRPITDNAPLTTVGAVGYTSAGGPNGTVVVITGEPTFGANSYLGVGALFSRDLGASWQRATGPLSDAFGFAVEVDQADPSTVYLATGKGLWRSTDAGATYTDVVLPTGDCAGKYDVESCNFANFVTDVVVKAPGGVGADTDGGQVVATVGWRAGMRENADGTVQSAENGVYRSDDGAPGTFARLPGLDAAAGGKERLGRIELGPAVGPEQDHDYLYALVQDAVLFNGGFPVLDLPESNPAGANATVLNGSYVSADFGATWTLLADDLEMAAACPANESVYCIPGLISPGAQSWYNQWIEPDPSAADPLTGAPTRVLLGLEEIWQTRNNLLPQTTGATSFQVIGRYYGALGCLLAATGCADNRVLGITTPHPDQHAAIFLPSDEGVRLLVGHDGGLSSQTAGAPGLDDFDQMAWELEQEDTGLETLLPYSAVIANDGVAYAGLQDNGHMRLSPADGFRKFETFGADGTFAAVDPENSDYAFESVQGGLMNVTVDGGQTWRAVEPPATDKKFVNPFVMDPLDPNHLTTGGRQINETTAGPDVANGDAGNEWATVFDLGTVDPLPIPDAPEPPANGMSAIDTRGPITYAGFCGVCDILNSPYPFTNGIATNAGTSTPPNPGTGDGWHEAAAAGLPNRYITSVAIDPDDASGATVYVTLGGYSRRWTPPGTAGDDGVGVGEGHVFRSTDFAESFVDISGDLPDVPALWVEPRGDQLLIGTDIGAYISSDTSGGAYSVLGDGELPATPVTSIQMKADDDRTALLGLYGRGLWLYEFDAAPLDLPEASTVVRRLGGRDRSETAARIAREGGGGDTVVIARQDGYADALAGAPLAHREDAPLLLTTGSQLGAAARSAVQERRPTRALLLGGPAALSPQVEADLRALGVTEVVRFSGTNRFDTARLIAEEIGGEAGAVYLTKGSDPDRAKGWPDAMSIAPVAAVQQRPVLLVETDRVPAETLAALETLGVETGRIVGGPAAVSARVEQQLRERLRLADRIAGADRYQTSALAAAVGVEAGLSASAPFLAQGLDYPDALSAGPTVSRLGGVLLLVDPRDLDRSAATRDYLLEQSCRAAVVRILGLEVAISTAVEAQVRELLRTCRPRVVQPDQLGEPLFAPFGFEADAQGWEVATAGGPDSAWERAEPGAGGSTTSFAVAPYGELADTTLTSPELAADGADVALVFDARYDVEGGGFDETAVQYSVDGGTTWTTVDTLGGQNPGFPEFAQHVVPLPETAPTLRVRFVFTSDEVCSSNALPVCARAEGFEGTFLDDVTLVPVG